MNKANKKTELDERYWKLMRRVALNIKSIRKNKGLTQEGLGFERRWFQRIESGSYSVSLPTLDKVARELKVDISELFKK